MQVNKTNLENLFTHERRYLVPLFQRPYVWTEEKQWAPLWEDLRDIAERELELANADYAPEDVQRPHFLGAIVLQPRALKGDHKPVMDVIDGQQRLTTLQILLMAIRDVASEIGDDVTQNWCVSRTVNPNVVVDVEVERHKLWPTQRDVPQYLDIASAGSRAALEHKYPGRVGRKPVTRPVMVEAYVYFSKKIAEWIAEVSAPTDVTRALRLALRDRLEIVQIDLEQRENPQEIFETLNARGEPLLASDLLRNFIFRRAKTSAESDMLYGKYWKRFEEPLDPEKPDGLRFWETEVSQGRLSRARLDLYVQHYLAMKLERDVRIGELFREYKGWIDRDRPFKNVEEELREFVTHAGAFARLVRGDTSTSLGVFGTRLATMEIGTVYPFLLGVLGDARVSPGEVDGILVDLESFLVRRMICQRPTKNYTRKFLELLRSFRAQSTLDRKTFRAVLSAGGNDAVFDWPTDAQFEDGWMRIDAYLVLKANRTEMVLRRLEEALRSAQSEPVLFADRLTVEHVMPQKWEASWPLPADLPEEKARDDRESVIHSFGNLTLLTQSLNSTLSNSAPATKFPAMNASSNLQLSKWFHGRTSWSEQDIRERSRALFETALKVWPRPPAA